MTLHTVFVMDLLCICVCDIFWLCSVVPLDYKNEVSLLYDNLRKFGL